MRFNPDGKYLVGGVEIFKSREERENVLRDHIFSMMKPDFVPNGYENVHYLFYPPRVSESGPPVVLSSDEYPEILESIVSWSD